jgi:hypothetical protein
MAVATPQTHEVRNSGTKVEAKYSGHKPNSEHHLVTATAEGTEQLICNTVLAAQSVELIRDCTLLVQASQTD